MNMTIQTDRTLIREAGNSVRHVLLSFEAPAPLASASRPPINVSFVIDRSGSMDGRKIQLARAAVLQALRMLRETDRFSVISYDNEVDVVVPSTPAAQEALRNATVQVQGIQARGSTNLSGGWLAGCEQIAEHLASEHTTRCLLVSDGLANEGITDRDELSRHSEALAARGIRTSCLGVGADYDEALLARIATASGGHSYHVETAEQIPDYLTSEIGDALETVARDVVITVRPPAGTEVSALNLYRTASDADGTFSLHLGDLVARQEVSLAFRLKFPSGESGATLTSVFSVADARNVLAIPDHDIVWTFAGHAENDRQPRNRVVDRAVAELDAAAARAEALELNRRHDFAHATMRLDRVVRRIRRYADTDPELLRIVQELQEGEQMYAAPLAAMERKAAYAQSFNTSRMRDASGKVRRRPPQ